MKDYAALIKWVQYTKYYSLVIRMQEKFILSLVKRQSKSTLNFTN